MNKKHIIEWFSNIDEQLDPPGCETEFVSPPSGKNGCFTVGIVHEHRFAFFYWGLYSHDCSQKPPPVLITLDSHNDVGVSNEVIPEDLDNLNIGDRKELGMFTWLRLRSLNDGHILPALYLNFFSDVYVLNKPEDSLVFQPNNSQTEHYDRMGNKHTVKFYRQADQLLQNLPTGIPVYLDIDLDYFTTSKPQTDSPLGNESLLADDKIKTILSLRGPFMEELQDRLVGLTIALEPRYCGGLSNSLHLLDILNREFFDSTLWTHSCNWKNVKP